MDTRRNDKAAGITFYMWERQGRETRGEAAYNARKLHLDGRVSLTLATNQYKYGDELIAQVYSKEKGRVLDRQADGYGRIQVYLGTADLETAEMLIQIANQIKELHAHRADSADH